MSLAADGTFVASYSLFLSTQDSSGWSAYVQRFGYAPNGQGGWQVTPQGAPFLPYVDVTGDQGVTPVAAPDGSFVAVIDQVRPGEDENVFLRHFAADGTPLDAGLLPVTTAPGDQWRTGAGLDAAGDLVVSWRDGGWGNAWDLYVRRFDPAGAPLTDPIRVTPTTVPYHPWSSTGAVAVAPDGNFQAAWTTYRADPGEWGVDTRHYDPI